MGGSCGSGESGVARQDPSTLQAFMTVKSRRLFRVSAKEAYGCTDKRKSLNVLDLPNGRRNQDLERSCLGWCFQICALGILGSFAESRKQLHDTSDAPSVPLSMRCQNFVGSLNCLVSLEKEPHDLEGSFENKT